MHIRNYAIFLRAGEAGNNFCFNFDYCFFFTCFLDLLLPVLYLYCLSRHFGHMVLLDFFPIYIPQRGQQFFSFSSAYRFLLVSFWVSAISLLYSLKNSRQLSHKVYLLDFLTLFPHRGHNPLFFLLRYVFFLFAGSAGILCFIITDNQISRNCFLQRNFKKPGTLFVGEFNAVQGDRVSERVFAK